MKFVPKALLQTADASRGRVTLKTVAKLLIEAAVFFVALYFTLGLLADIAAHTIPDSWEQRLALFSDDAGVDAAGYDGPRAVLDRLIAGEDLRELDYGLLVIDSPDPNAFAFLGGTVTVTTGLLDLLETEEGLAFVLAHEIGHIENRHVLRNLGRGLLYGLARVVLFGQQGFLEIEQSLRLAEAGYSRSQEKAADEYAIDLVYRKYGSAGDFLEFFEKIQEIGGEPAWQAYLGSHPSTGSRVQALQEILHDRQRESIAPAGSR